VWGVQKQANTLRVKQEHVMGTASPKSVKIDEILTAISGNDRVASINANICNWCRGDVIGFADDISAVEYGISGLCQKCQDDVFKEPEDG
jgi:hypothetical protein